MYEMIAVLVVVLIIIAIPLYFLIKWMMVRMKVERSTGYTILAGVSAAVLSPVILGGIIVAIIVSISYYPDNTFSRQKWMENKEERYKLSSDIIDSEILIGKTEKEVVQLLGDDYYQIKGNEIYYDLGFVPGLFSVGPDVLEIVFEKGQVVRVEQRGT
ncbi:hypothetical protein J1N10_02785 [Carboxylicivirga sp. A043]|uniref:hypothetical protein n=1 Tax=Carboxylicivirga litoralis TaxID=2816963 RepID=UPI0021CB1A3F|nr:hypothetical protein [Carboxylicivirga sp. A043]MCU4154884.1 hypothetical protein [Carboxylicivirga sp. A043]